MASDFCPLIKKKCKEHGCKFFIQVYGKDPQTGLDINGWDCAITWLPTLLIEGSQQTRQAGAAIESFRNEVVKTQSLIDISGAQVEQIENQQTDNNTPEEIKS
jgi:hypothetical protein